MTAELQIAVCLEAHLNSRHPGVFECTTKEKWTLLVTEFSKDDNETLTQNKADYLFSSNF